MSLYQTRIYFGLSLAITILLISFCCDDYLYSWPIDRSRRISILTKTESHTYLSDVLIAVKTTGKYHSSRLQLILETWFPLVSEQTYFFTDVDALDFQNKTNGHMVNTECKANHKREGLCCKLSRIFRMYYNSPTRWLCQFDDDNYVNVPQLINLLRQYDHNQDFYIGRESIVEKMKCIDSLRQKVVQFWFATGGAGVCYSKALAKKMKPYISGGNLSRICRRIKQSDDVAIGFIVESLLNGSLTKTYSLNSHLQNLAEIPAPELQNQVTLSYRLSKKKQNIINMTAIMTSDPTRLKSFHCKYFRGTKEEVCSPN